MGACTHQTLEKWASPIKEKEVGDCCCPWPDHYPLCSILTNYEGEGREGEGGRKGGNMGFVKNFLLPDLFEGSREWSRESNETRGFGEQSCKLTLTECSPLRTSPFLTTEEQGRGYFQGSSYGPSQG